MATATLAKTLLVIAMAIMLPLLIMSVPIVTTMLMTTARVVMRTMLMTIIVDSVFVMTAVWLLDSTGEERA